jgi:large subunit ribosomal protein L40
MIRHFLHHPTLHTPRPLRFSRNRALRHWTIQRAFSLFYHKTRLARERELERQWRAMFDANEELRTGVGDGGRLFRRGMMKTGTWSIPERGGGVPIEYARGLVEWVGSVGGTGGTSRARVWDEGWRRWK